MPININDPIEYKSVDFKIKNLDEADENFFIFSGLASTFGNVDIDGDTIDKNAFDTTLINRTPVILWQHQTKEPIGMPIKIEVTEEGLFITAKLPKDDSLVKGRVIPQIKIGSTRTMSIGFSTVDSENMVKNGINVRVIKELVLFEISIVSIPANTKAKIEAFKTALNDECTKESKTLVSHFDTFKKTSDLSEFLRSVGLSHKESNAFLSITKSLSRNDDSEKISSRNDEELRGDQKEASNEDLKMLIDEIIETKKILEKQHDR